MQKKFFKKNKNNKGYTIIETMVAISLFLVIVIFGMNALLNVNLVNQKSQDMRSVIDNLSFIMEEMSRNLRTGYNYRCYDLANPWGDGAVDSGDIVLETPRSCALGGGVLVFEEASGAVGDPSDQWAYKIESTSVDANGDPVFNIFKSVSGGGATGSSEWVQLNPNEVVLNSASGFTVFGAEPPASGDNQQPFVIIRLVGEVRFKNIVSPFSLQTSVSQRSIDIESAP